MRIQPLEQAWAAGFFDGEGHIAARYTKHLKKSGAVYYWRRIEIQVTQKHPEVLLRFKDAVGVGRVGGPYHSCGRSMYKFHAAGYPATSKVLEAILPYLSSVKRKQVEEALRWYEESPASYKKE